MDVDKFLSLDNFKFAWRKVAENQGSCGIDRENIDDFLPNEDRNLIELRDSVASSQYQPLPYKQVFIPKSQGKWRELRIPTVRDRIVQQALVAVLNPAIDAEFHASSFGYRPRLSYINAVEKVAEYRDLGNCWVLDADIEGFFDNINRQILLAQLRRYIPEPGILCLIKSWISAGIQTDNGVVFPEKGIAQGAVISPLLANIYLNQFDWVLSKLSLKLVRYADDFLILAPEQQEIERAYVEVDRCLQNLDLKLHPTKTQITNFDRGFRFLGHGFLDRAIFPLDDGSAASGRKKDSSKKKQQLPKSNMRK